MAQGASSLHRRFCERLFQKSDTVGKRSFPLSQRLRRFATVLCGGWETAPRAVSQPPHKRIMSEPRSGEGFPNGIKVWGDSWANISDGMQHTKENSALI